MTLYSYNVDGINVDLLIFSAFLSTMREARSLTLPNLSYCIKINQLLHVTAIL